MGTRISQRELRNDNAEIVRRVERGERFVITRNGVAVADLVPHVDRARQRFVPVEDVASGLAACDDWGVPAFEQEQAALDVQVDDELRDPWTRSG